jgi:SAM-dependent methyltransferase
MSSEKLGARRPTETHVHEYEKGYEGQPESRVIVEVGAGRYSGGAFTPIVERRRFDANEQYIGIDLGVRGGFSLHETEPDSEQDTLMRQNWSRIKANRPQESIEFLQADGTKLPLGDETADEVIFSNVFGFGAAPENRPVLLREANRIIKPDGIIVIHDDMSPYHTSQERMEVEARGGNLVPDGNRMLLVRQDQDPEGYRELAQRYGFDTDSLFPNNTIWLIRKLDPELPPERPPRARWWRRG